MKTALAVLLFVVAVSSCVPVGVAGEYDYGYPPDSYIATATPVYYEGYPSYYWNDHWYRREGARWHYYHSEPSYLHGYRSRVVAAPRANYGRGSYYGHSRGGGGWHGHH